MKREKSRQTLYLLAGIYLVYLAYSMFQMLRSGEVPESDRGFMILFCALFAVLGLGIAAVCGRKLYRIGKGHTINRYALFQETGRQVYLKFERKRGGYK